MITTLRKIFARRSNPASTKRSCKVLLDVLLVERYIRDRETEKERYRERKIKK